MYPIREVGNQILDSNISRLDFGIEPETLFVSLCTENSNSNIYHFEKVFSCTLIHPCSETIIAAYSCAALRDNTRR